MWAKEKKRHVIKLLNIPASDIGTQYRTISLDRQLNGGSTLTLKIWSDALAPSWPTVCRATPPHSYVPSQYVPCQHLFCVRQLSVTVASSRAMSLCGWEVPQKHFGPFKEQTNFIARICRHSMYVCIHEVHPCKKRIVLPYSIIGMTFLYQHTYIRKTVFWFVWVGP